MGKTRATLRLKQKVQGKKSHNKSEDLTRLTEQYNAFTNRLQGLVSALVTQHAAMQEFGKAKIIVAKHLALLSKDTVLFETTGQTAGADRSSDSVNSYFSVQEEVSNKTKNYADKYKQFIVDYAQEWYKTITDRVGADLKKAEKIRVELDHYQSKVESLRQSANATMAKGKQVDGKAAEKLTRNEDKLIKIKEASSKFINELCLLMEEITERSWRDLHPLLIKCSQFETQVSEDEAKAMASLNKVVAALKQIASDHGIKPQARLKDLATVDPYVLSTRSKDDNRNPALENGFTGLALGGSSVQGSAVSATTGDNDSQYFPPGSTSAQGLGGFPVRVQPADTSNGYNQGQSTTSTATNANANASPSTMSMMNINAAPAPTMDTMAQAFGPSAGAPSNGSVYGGTTSSYHSAFAESPAPPPSAAPPPPPPTPSDSYGGHYNGFGGVSPAPKSNAFGAAPQYGASSPATPQMMGGAYGSGYSQQSPTPHSMGVNYAQQPSPMAPAGANFAQQPSNFAQQPSMHSGQHHPQHSAPQYYGSGANPSNPFG